MFPTDIIHDSLRVEAYTEDDEEDARQNAVDLLEEERELALQRSAIYQQNLRRYHSRKVRRRSFREGDLVLRLIQDRKGMHKLSPPWEGPFVVSKVLFNGSYYLVDLRDKEKKKSRKRKRGVDQELDETKRPWNIAQLRPYYT